MKVLAALVLVIIIEIFVALPSFKPKQTSNNPICQKINQKGEKYCQNLDNNPKNVCLAALKKDSSVCERIENSETKDDCYRDYSRLS